MAPIASPLLFLFTSAIKQNLPDLPNPEQVATEYLEFADRLSGILQSEPPSIGRLAALVTLTDAIMGPMNENNRAVVDTLKSAMKVLRESMAVERSMLAEAAGEVS